MKKYLVDVFVPAAGIHMDAFLPSDKPIGEVIQILGSLAKTVSNNTYLSTENTMLLFADSGIPLNVQDSVEQALIRNASRLILI